MLTFNSETGFSVSEVTDIRGEVAQAWKDAFQETGKPELNTDPETPQGQLIDSQTAAIQQKDAELAFIASMFNPKTSKGIWQDALGKIYYLIRKPAIASSATCTLTGLYGTVIESGAQIRSSYDSSLWTLQETVTIGEDGTIEGVFTCNDAGAIEAGANTLNQIVTTVAGWDSVTNETSATVGQAEETQASFEARRYNSVALNARGTASAVYARVARVANVIACYVLENKTNQNKVVDGYTLTPHSIYVAVLGDSADDDAIAEAIYKTASAGCDYNGNTSVQYTDEYTGAIETILFERPAAFNVYVQVTIQDINLPDGYENIIKQAVYNNFYGADTETTIAGEAILRVIMGDDVYASRFMPSILNAEISSLLSVQVSTDGTTWTDTVHMPIDGAPTLSTDNILIEVSE